MGLLHKASSRVIPNAASIESDNQILDTNFSLDEMGKALCEKIKRLSQEKNAPYTALSLLKAYETFHSGICLSLCNSIYSSYTSIGYSSGPVSIPQETIWTQEETLAPYFMHNSPKSLGIKSSHDDINYWIFSLDLLHDASIKPWRKIIIFGVLPPSGLRPVFNPESIFAILSKATDKFLIGADAEIQNENSDEINPVNNPASENEASESAASESEASDQQDIEPLPEIKDAPNDINNIEEKIVDYHYTHAKFNCIVIEIPETPKPIEAVLLPFPVPSIPKKTAPIPNSVYCYYEQPEPPDSPDQGEKDTIFNKISEMLTLTGPVYSLSNNRALVLISDDVDRELVIHRLSKVFKIKPIKSFEADSPENAFSKIINLL